MQSDWEAEVSTTSNFSSQQDENFQSDSQHIPNPDLAGGRGACIYVSVHEFSVHVSYVT